MDDQITTVGPRLRRWVDRLSGALDLPPEVVLDVPKITLVGTLHLQVENHRGILEYTPERVRIRVSDGELVVTGDHLRIGSIFQQELAIEGRITGMQLPAGGGRT